MKFGRKLVCAGLIAKAIGCNHATPAVNSPAPEMPGTIMLEGLRERCKIGPVTTVSGRGSALIVHGEGCDSDVRTPSNCEPDIFIQVIGHDMDEDGGRKVLLGVADAEKAFRGGVMGKAAWLHSEAVIEATVRGHEIKVMICGMDGDSTVFAIEGSDRTTQMLTVTPPEPRSRLPPDFI